MIKRGIPCDARQTAFFRVALNSGYGAWAFCKRLSMYTSVSA
ncbi:Uncharacterised protein [Vibrio cholerae]|nr:Uncharacterised protein [Vibrio cholerae]